MKYDTSPLMHLTHCHLFHLLYGNLHLFPLLLYVGLLLQQSRKPKMNGYVQNSPMLIARGQSNFKMGDVLRDVEFGTDTSLVSVWWIRLHHVYLPVLLQQITSLLEGASTWDAPHCLTLSVVTWHWHWSDAFRPGRAFVLLFWLFSRYPR